MKKYLSAIAAICLGISAYAYEISADSEKTQYGVVATSETYAGSNYDFKFGSWQKADSSKSFVAIDWEKKSIELTDNGAMIEGPYSIASVSDEYRDGQGRPSVKIVVYDLTEGYADEEMSVVFILTASEGDSVKNMTAGYLFQVFDQDVYGFELRR